jgi:hypothetical protein
MAGECGTDPVNGELDELTREVRKVIEENRKFLERVMDDEFEEEEETDYDLPDEEL